MSRLCAHSATRQANFWTWKLLEPQVFASAAVMLPLIPYPLTLFSRMFGDHDATDRGYRPGTAAVGYVENRGHQRTTGLVRESHTECALKGQRDFVKESGHA